MPNKMLQFPSPQTSSEEKESGRVVFEIGVQRFAIDYLITDLDQKEMIPLHKKRLKNKRPVKRIQSTPNFIPSV